MPNNIGRYKLVVDLREGDSDSREVCLGDINLEPGKITCSMDGAVELIQILNNLVLERVRNNPDPE